MRSRAKNGASMFSISATAGSKIRPRRNSSVSRGGTPLVLRWYSPSGVWYR